VLTLSLARGLFLVLGGGALLLSAGNLSGMLAPGATFDLAVPGGFALGALLLAGGAFVESGRPLLAALCWLALVVVVVLCAVLVWITFSSARDAILYALVPVSIVLLATARLAVARVRAGVLGASAAGS